MGTIRLLGLLIAALLLLPSSAVLAQDASAAPVERTPEMEQQAAELETLFPDEVAGTPIADEIEIRVGEELFADSSEEDAAAVQALVDSVSKERADLAVGNAVLDLGETGYLWMGAFRISGADAEVFIDALGKLFGSFVDQPRLAPTEVAGREVIALSDDASPDAGTAYLYAAGDVVWIIAVDDEATLAEVISKLP